MVLFPEGAPHEKAGAYIEKNDISGPKNSGLTVNRMSGVSVPLITIYNARIPSRDNKTVVVCPGGGYGILAYDLEGTEICRMLSDNGINAVLLKYRVPRREGREKHAAALEDVQRAISVVRSRADEFGLNPNQIGVMGFSAGAHLSVMASNSERTYAKIDSCDNQPVRPDFCAIIYPAYLSGANFGLAADVKPSPQTPPTFIVQAQDDTNYIDSALFYYYALKDNKVPVTMHLYSDGGHGYGLRQTGKLVNTWPLRFVEWVKSL
ncbi:MAG: alpha/beta hydrolase [Rikenellaceae bacterium]